MKQVVELINVFALLSLLAVGGGSAVIPQMKRDTVDRHQWVTEGEFATIYSLGQLAPGPNMSMVSLIGYHVAGPVGAIAVLAAFFFPACLLTYIASHVWDSCRGSPWRDAVQKGMAPITIGLMLAGVYSIGKTASFNTERPMETNLITLAIGALVVAILFWKRINPALLILSGGVVGFFLLRQ